MKKTITKLTILASCSWFIVASGLISGGDGPGGQYAVYDDLSSTADKTSQLHGIAELANQSNSSVKLTVVSATLNHKSGALTINTDGNAFNAPNGPDANYAYADGNSKLSFNATVTGDYKYVATYQQSFNQGNIHFDVSGILGIKSKASEISNEVIDRQYSGRVSAVLVTSKHGLDLKDGKALLAANFKTGSLDVSLTDFSATDLETGQPAATPFTDIKIANMKINGATFSGGELKISNGVVPVQLVGANEMSVAEGAFFGGMSNAGSLNKQGAPLEAGGQFLVQGDNGSLSGTFLAK